MSGEVIFLPLLVQWFDAGLCDLSQSFKASSTRVCQPFPVERKASTTSGDRRILTGAFVISFRGLPRLSIFSAIALGKISCNTSDARRALAKSVSVYSGFSSSMVDAVICCFANLAISFHLLNVGFPKTDNAYSIFTWSKHNGIETIINVP